MKIVLFSVLLQALAFANCFIIPDEVPSILSVIYSNIPTIKKGTDSRLGWGFRLGDRADFQVLVELGPQLNTQRLANQKESGNSKRDAIGSLSDVLYAQRQREKNEKAELTEESKTATETNQESDGGKWLKTWAKTHQPIKASEPKLEPKPGLAIGEIDAKSVLPDDETLEKQEKLKKKKLILKSEPVSTSEKPLDDVSLE